MEWSSLDVNDDGEVDKSDEDCGDMLGTIGDKVFKDLDGDGVQDPNEPGVGGVEVCLYTCNALGMVDYANPVECQTTGADGLYLFENLLQGDYSLGYDISGLPEGCDFTYQNAGGDDNADSDVNRYGNSPSQHSFPECLQQQCVMDYCGFRRLGWDKESCVILIGLLCNSCSEFFHTALLRHGSFVSQCTGTQRCSGACCH